MASAASLRVLGLTAKATQAQVKSAYRLLAKEWHPDKHQGRAKAAAEARFKQIVGAYEQLSSGAADSEDAARTGYSGGMQWPGGVHGPGRHAQGSGTRRDGPQRGSAYESWGTREQYGEAHRAGYNPYRGYMDFDPQTPAGEARARTEQQQTTRSRLSLGLFVFGFGAIVWTARRDNRRLEKGELVEAFFNNVSSLCPCPARRSPPHEAAAR